MTKGFYVNLMAPDEGAARIRATYGGNFDRLAKLKRRSTRRSEENRRAYDFGSSCCGRRRSWSFC
jgi:hypothetical protein